MISYNMASSREVSMHARLTLAIVTVAFLGRVSACNAFSEMFCTGDTCLKRTSVGVSKAVAADAEKKT